MMWKEAARGPVALIAGKKGRPLGIETSLGALRFVQAQKSVNDGKTSLWMLMVLLVQEGFRQGLLRAGTSGTSGTGAVIVCDYGRLVSN